MAITYAITKEIYNIFRYYKGSMIYIEVELSTELDDIHNWCIDNFGPYIGNDRWSCNSSNVKADFFIRKKEDLMLFKLRWL